MSITTIYKCDACGTTKEFTEHGVCAWELIPVGHDLKGWGSIDLGPYAEVSGIETPRMLCEGCIIKAANHLGLKIEPAPVTPGEFSSCIPPYEVASRRLGGNFRRPRVARAFCGPVYPVPDVTPEPAHAQPGRPADGTP